MVFRHCSWPSYHAILLQLEPGIRTIALIMCRPRMGAKRNGVRGVSDFGDEETSAPVYIFVLTGSFENVGLSCYIGHRCFVGSLIRFEDRMSED